MSTYEVTVPLVVVVKDGSIVRTYVDRGYPGFFSESEEAGGVWSVDDERWDDEAENVGVLARNAVRALLRRQEVGA